MRPGPIRPLALLIPGAIDQLTGGYLYARRLVEGLRAAGRAVAVHELPGRFPDADDAACAAAAAALATLPPAMAAVIDGLALPGFADCLAHAAGRRPILALVHHPLALETGLAAAASRRFRDLESRLLRVVAGVICPSVATAAAVADYGVSRSRIGVVGPGTVKPAARLERRPHDGPLRLLSVGTVTPRKGHAVLVEALAMLGARSWRLTIVGSLTRDPATAAALRRAIALGRLEDRVQLAGEWPPERLAEAYAASDVFVLPSHHEGYGMVFAEAMAHGLPILATGAGAIPEIVPPTAGILVPVGEAPALAAALARLLDDAGLRRRLGCGAVAAAAPLPSWAEAVRRWIEVSDGLLA